MARTFHIVIERDEEGWYIGDVPELPGCHTQGETLEELRANIREAIALYLEAKDPIEHVEFIGVEEISVDA